MMAANDLEISGDRGGVLVIVDPPPSFVFGVDCMEYETGPNFKGVVLIPPGFHFFYYSTGMGSREGFFLKYLNKNRVKVKVWDNVYEELSSVKTLSHQSLEVLQKDLEGGHLDKYLGPYPISQQHLWKNISNMISDQTLIRACIPENTAISPGDCEDIAQAQLSNVTPVSLGAPRTALFSDVTSIESAVKFDLARDLSHRGALLSHSFLDKSQVTERLIYTFFAGRWEELLAEIQLSFLLFMLLYSYPALEQWKRLISLICSSESYMLFNQEFTCLFLRIFYEQLNFSPDDFFETELSKSNFLNPCLTNLFESLHNNRYIVHDHNRLDQWTTASSSTSTSSTSATAPPPLSPPPAQGPVVVLSHTLQEILKRFRVFVQKKFNILNSDDAERGGGRSGHMPPPHTPAHTPFEGANTDNSHIYERDKCLNERDLNLLQYSSELYNLMEDCHPVVVPYEETLLCKAQTQVSSQDTIDNASETNAELGTEYGGSGSTGVWSRRALTKERIDDANAVHALSAGVAAIEGGGSGTRERLLRELDEQDTNYAARTAEEVSSSVLNGQMSSQSIQDQMYCWRYPLVYQSMVEYNSVPQHGKEDMCMAAMRILDDAFDGQMVVQVGEEGLAHIMRLKNEAVQFIESEMVLFGG